MHPDAIEPAERALRLHLAGDDVRAEALSVLDHYKKRFADGEKPAPPAAVGDTERGLPRWEIPNTREALRARYQAEEKRRNVLIARC